MFTAQTNVEIIKKLNENVLTELTLINIRAKNDIPANFLLAKDNVCSITLLKDTRVASVTMDGIKIWDIDTQRCVSVLAEEISTATTTRKDRYEAVATLPDGRLISSNGWELQVWDVDKGRCGQKIKVDRTTRITPLTGNRVVCSASTEKVLKIWNVDEAVCTINLQGHEANVTCVIVLPDNRVISGSEDKTIKIWDSNTGQCIQTLLTSEVVKCMAVLSNGQVVSSSGNVLNVWNMETGSCIKTVELPNASVNSMAVLSENQLVCGSSYRRGLVIDVISGSLITEFKSLGGNSLSTIKHVIVLPDNRLIVSTSASGEHTFEMCDVRVFRSLTQQEQFEILTEVKNNLSLKSLSLAKINWSEIPDFIPALKKMLESNSEIESLDLSNAGLTDAMLREILLVASKRKKVLSLTVEGNPLSTGMKEKVAQYLQGFSMSQSSENEQTNVLLEKEKLFSSKEKIVFSYSISYGELEFGRELGQGGFGIVYQGIWRKHTDVAIKQLRLTQFTPHVLKDFEHEVEIMAQLRSPHIVQLYGATFNKAPYCMVIEYMQNGSLFHMLHSNESVTWQQRQSIALDVAKGLAFLHFQNILHRDLKSLNVLLDKQLNAKLSDFGLSTVKVESHSLSTSKNQKSGVGTLCWMAPELFKRKAVCTKETDMYSYGMTLWEIASREVPFKDAASQDLIPTWVSQGEREEIPKDTPHKIAKIITFCWDMEPSKRPSADRVVEMLKEEVDDRQVSSQPQYLGNFDSRK